MQTLGFRRTLAALVIASTLPALTSGQTPTNILPEGGMIGEIGATPRGWQSPHATYLQRIGGALVLKKDPLEPGNFVSFLNTDNTKLVRLETQLEVEPSWIGRTLVINAKMRVGNLKPGSESWHLAGVHLSYTRDTGKISYAPGRLKIEEDTPEWSPFTTRWVIADDAQLINIGVGLMGATGTLDVRDLEILLE